MADSKLKAEIEKLKNNANVDDGLKQVVLELQNEVVQFENRIKKIIEKANNKLMISPPSQKSEIHIQNVAGNNINNNYDDIQEDDLWIPKELLSDEVKIPEMQPLKDSSNIDFLSLINKSTPRKKNNFDVDIIEPMEEKITKSDINNNVQEFKSFSDSANLPKFDSSRTLKVTTSDNKNFTISQIKQNENIQKINFAIERNNDLNKKNVDQPLRTQVIRNIEKTNDIDNQYKGFLSKHSLNKELREINYILKRRDREEVNKKRKSLAKTRIIKLNSNSPDNTNNEKSSFSKTIKISFRNNKNI
ncbi:hypothetical protein [Malacoplasma iowae]|uniref:Uncharacterized protein n=2 Tax=Malacoplasma iowae TaxID=2116 RepID=A0A6P1LCI3_MALIO|nr:hypothetical protein [Malacoplasma iowae]QHG89897.1 hypothetical protein EER00_03305 [Malacoplasma iowae 695]WPL35293.1 hypothetical protein QX180_03095 [Malacoplasma iowae]VEU62249.1 Uncharacterised protein [Mycoplasmopsis fermentans]VEU72483.1 Uncharacterised protein [Malacoplasma iowae]